MDQVTETIVADLEARLERLETEHNRAPVRTVLGVGGDFEIVTVHRLPAIPSKPKIVFLESVDVAELPELVPKPSANDSYWWTVKEDVRWHPFGGKFVKINGDPGNISAV